MEKWGRIPPQSPGRAIVMSFAHDDMAETLRGLVQDLLGRYDEFVSERGEFPDARVGRTIQFGDPDVTLPGKVELVVMHMDARLDRAYDVMRFVSVRVMKSREGGWSSLTCLHGTREQLRQELEQLARDPDFLVERVSELADGLPEESNPDLWR